MIVVAAVIFERGRVLLTRRPAGTHLADHWEFPGGKIEPGEDPRVALQREMLEETALDIDVGDIFDVTFWRYPRKDVLLLFYVASRRDPARSIEHRGVADHAWVDASEIDAYAMPPADQSMLQKVKARLLAEARR